MLSVGGLMTEVSAAFQFPPYFGRNWAALDDMLSDTGWNQHLQFVIVVAQPELVLMDESPCQLSRFATVLGCPNPAPNRESRSVYTVLWFEKEPEQRAMRRWMDAGVELGPTSLV
jgi:hypothetical protein